MNQLKHKAALPGRAKLALLLGGALLSGVASAASFTLTPSRTYDGAEKTDGSLLCAADLDGSRTNGVLCTNDTAQYNIAYRVEANDQPQHDVTLTLTIPAGEPFKFTGGMSCRNANPISADGKTLTCLLRGTGSNPPDGPIANQTGDLPVMITTTGAAKHGDVLSNLTAKISSTEDTTGLTATAPGLEVAAKPQVDLVKTFVSTMPGQRRPAHCTSATSTETEGLVLRFRVALDIKAENGVGHEALANGWSYTENLDGISPEACIFTTNSYHSVAAQADQPDYVITGIGNYGFDKGAGGTKRVWAYTAADIASHDNVGSSYPLANPAMPVTSGEAVSSLGGVLNGTAFHEVRIWVPVSELRRDRTTGQPTSCSYSGTNAITGFAPKGISGEDNTGDLAANNSVAIGPIQLCSGGFTKQFTANTMSPLVSEGLNVNARISNQVVGPEQYFDSYFTYNNSGVLNQRITTCDRWDHRKMQVVQLDAKRFYSRYGFNVATQQWNSDGTRDSYYRHVEVTSTNSTMYPPTKHGETAFAHINNMQGGDHQPPFIYIDDGSAKREIEFGYVPALTNGQFDERLLRQGQCEDGQSELIAAANAGGEPASAVQAIAGTGWITQSALQANPSLAKYVNTVRMNNVIVPPGRSLSIFVHLQALSQDPFDSSVVWPDGSILPNYGAFKRDGTWFQTRQAMMGNDPQAAAIVWTQANPTPWNTNCTTTQQTAYCDDSYSDRLRLAKFTVGVRKGVAGVDAEGGPLRDTPPVVSARGEVVTYQLWPKLVANSDSVTVDTDVTLVDTIPRGLRMVPGTLRFNGQPIPDADWHLEDNNNPDQNTYVASTLKVILRNLKATSPATAIPAVEFDAEVVLEDADNRGGQQRINTVVVDACSVGASLNQATGALTCTSQTPAMLASERTARRTINLTAAASLVVQKTVIGETRKEIGSSFQMGLRYFNSSDDAVAEHRLIDILPYNGEPNRGYPDVAAQATNYAGQLKLEKVTAARTSNYWVYYTTAAPADIDADPKCAINYAAPVGNWPAYAPGVLNVSGCKNSASVTWTLATQSTSNPAEWTGFPEGTTAIQLVDKNLFPTGGRVRESVIEFSTPGSHHDNHFSNNVSAGNGGPGTASVAGAGSTLSTSSNNVTVTVFASSLSGAVFEDTNNNALTTGYEPGTDTPLPGVTVTLMKGDEVIATAVTAAADIPAGQYYDRTTGLASATPNENTCPVPAGGLLAGQYLFCNLVAGNNYAVVEGPTPGYTTAGNTAGTPVDGTASNRNDAITSIVIGQDENVVGYDFGEHKAATVSGNVSVVDTNAPIENVEVSLTYTYTVPGESAPRTATVTTRTDASGNYSFPSVPEGATNLVIEQTQPDNFISESNAGGTNGGVADATNLNRITIPSITMAGSQNNNFVERPVTVVGGSVFARNGGTDTPIDGVPIALTYTPPGSTTPVTVTTTTAADGSYQFPNIPVGSTDLRIVETQPVGYANVGNAAGGSSAVDQGHGDGTSTITIATLAAGGSLNNNFIETNATDPVTGRVRDQDYAGILNVPITITYTPPGSSVPTSMTVLTDADGNYSVLLPRGSTGVVITETQPAGYVNAANEPAGNGAVDGGHTATTSVINVGTLPTGGSLNNNFVENTATTVSGRVYLAGSNAPIADVPIALTYTPPGGGAPVTVNTTTGADGSYQFTNLPVGATDLTIVETQPAAYANVSNEPGTGAASAGHTGTTSAITIAVLGANGSPNNNFVETDQTAPVGGRVVDQDGNPIADVTVTVTYTTPSGQQQTVTLTTDATGNYNALLPQGATNVVITETQPANYISVANEPGTGAQDGGSTSTASVITIATLPNSGSLNNNFVERAAANVAGRVYVAGTNAPLAGVPVALTYLPPGASAGEEVTVTTETEADGTYRFTNLPVGATNLRIVETQPANYANVSNNPGDDAADAGNTGTTSTITIAALGAGGSLNNDFVETDQTAPVGGRVVDQDGNPIAAVPVTVSYVPAGATDPVTVELTTDASGNYNVLLPQGATDVVITEQQPARYLNAETQPGTDATADASAPGTSTPSVIRIAALPAGGSTNNNFVEYDTAPVNGRVYVAGTNAPIAGVPVTLTYMPPWGTAPTDVVELTTTTDAEGNYEFPNLPVGATDLTIVETQPAGYANVANLPGTDATDDGNTAGATGGRSALRIARLRSGGSVGNNFVESQGVAPVSGSVATRTGTPIENVEIVITYTPPGMTTPTSITVLTDASGNYTADLPPGARNVTITETQPAGYLDAASEAGTGGANAQSANVITIGTLPDGGSTGNNFIEHSTARVAGRVLVQGTNLPLEGVPVRLTYTPPGGGTPVTVETTTDASGNYEFANLPVGATSLVIEETQPAGYSNAGNAANGDNAQDAGHTATASRILITELLAAGSLGNDFLEIQGTAPVSGRVYNNIGNGGIVDVAITITYTPPGGGAQVTMNLTTNGNGEYSANLPPGATDITITEAQPSGFTNVRNEPGTGATNSSGDDAGGTSNSVIHIATLAATGSTGNNFVEARVVGEVQPVPSLQAMGVLMLSLLMMGAYLSSTRRRQQRI